MGVVSPLAADLSLALGSSSVGLMELVSVYGCSQIRACAWSPMLSRACRTAGAYVGSGGHSASAGGLPGDRVLDYEHDGRRDPTWNGHGGKICHRPAGGRKNRNHERLHRRLVYRLDPNLATGAWVGFDDRRPLGETESGAHAALPIWIAFMKEALKRLPVVPFEIPDGVMFVKVDPTTALLTDQDEQHGTVELFTKGTEPTKSAGSKIDPTDFLQTGSTPGQCPHPPRSSRNAFRTHEYSVAREHARAVCPLASELW